MKLNGKPSYLILLLYLLFSQAAKGQMNSIKLFSQFDLINSAQPFSHSHRDTTVQRYRSTSLAFQRNKENWYSQFELGFHWDNRNNQEYQFQSWWVFFNYERGKKIWENSNGKAKLHFGGFAGIIYFRGEYEKNKHALSDPSERTRRGIHIGTNTHLRYQISSRISTELHVTSFYISAVNDHQIIEDSSLAKTLQDNTTLNFGLHLLGPLKVGLGYSF